ncbi:MAG: TlpA disulfide reductase family protein [Psychroserpens sp.]|uniref:TlpA family protein disulfide reductase n=1 Tax=Psychroserpens sp. TaxID=2020870 RepID=UPI0030024E49
MEDFIGNNAKFIIQWGQLIAATIIITAIFLLYLLGKNNKYFLPKGFLTYVIAIILIFLILICGMAFTKVTRMKPRVSVVLNALEVLHNKPAPSFDFNLLADDSKKNISDYKGKIILLNYWATWCAPCIKEMPELNRLQKKYQDQGLVIIALSDEDKETLMKFANKKPFIVSAAYSKEFNWADIQSERPMTFLINREGIIVDYFTGGYDYAFFESKIINYLNN